MQIGDKVVVVNYPPGPDRDRLLKKTGIVRLIAFGRYISVAIDQDTIPSRIFYQDELRPVDSSIETNAFVIGAREIIREVQKHIHGIVSIDPKEAQSTAVALGLKLGEVSLNDVIYSLSKVHNTTVDNIELESNKVFVGGAWQKSDVEVKSNRKIARGRKLSVWQYTSFTKASGGKRYEVQVNFPPELVWYTSANPEVRNKVFGSFEEATKAAAAQQRLMGDDYKYRAAEVTQ